MIAIWATMDRTRTMTRTPYSTTPPPQSVNVAGNHTLYLGATLVGTSANCVQREQGEYPPGVERVFMISGDNQCQVPPTSWFGAQAAAMVAGRRSVSVSECDTVNSDYIKDPDASCRLIFIIIVAKDDEVITKYYKHLLNYIHV